MNMRRGIDRALLGSSRSQVDTQLEFSFDLMDDPATIAYRAALPRLLAPLAPFSSAAALSAPKPTPTTPSRASSCVKCRAEVVGGLNGTFWLEEGAAWARCDGCGWATKREGDGDSKTRFAPVKRRRKDAAAREQLAPPPVLAVAGARAVKADLLPPPQSTSVQKAKPSLPASTSKASRPTALPTPAAIASRHPSPIPAPTPLSKSAPAPVPTPITATAPSKSKSTIDLAVKALTQKRKRAKQPSGLAEMLEAKRRSEKAATPTLGLQDFLQGI